MLISEEYLSNTHEKESDDVETLAVDAELLDHDNQIFWTLFLTPAHDAQSSEDQKQMRTGSSLT